MVAPRNYMDLSLLCLIGSRCVISDYNIVTFESFDNEDSSDICSNFVVTTSENQ